MISAIANALRAVRDRPCDGRAWAWARLLVFRAGGTLTVESGIGTDGRSWPVADVDVQDGKPVLVLAEGHELYTTDLSPRMRAGVRWEN